MTPCWPASSLSRRSWRVSSSAAVGYAPEEELALYVVHGLLHLCGYDDHDEAGVQAMRRRESEILALAGLSEPPTVLDRD